MKKTNELEELRNIVTTILAIGIDVGSKKKKDFDLSRQVDRLINWRNKWGVELLEGIYNNSLDTGNTINLDKLLANLVNETEKLKQQIENDRK